MKTKKTKVGGRCEAGGVGVGQMGATEEVRESRGGNRAEQKMSATPVKCWLESWGGKDYG